MVLDGITVTPIMELLWWPLFWARATINGGFRFDADPGARAQEALDPLLNKGGKSGPNSGILPGSGDPSDCLAWLDAPLRRASQPGSATTEASPNR